jgi:Kef-type K+ transport system membrane component KefB
MNAAFGVRFLPEDFRRLLFRPAFFAAFLPLDLDDLREDFLAEDFFAFFFVAILSPGLVIGCKCRVKRATSATQTIVLRGESNRESLEFPYEKTQIP